MSPPSPNWALRGRANFRSAQAPPVDAKIALREWISLADEIAARGGTVVCLMPKDDALTGLPYAAECGQIVSSDRFLLPNMLAPHRQLEREQWRALAIALRWKPIDVEGVWEAQGDVAMFRDRTILFWGGRTDRAGVTSAAKYFDDPIVVRIREPAFHGNMAVLPLDAVDRLVVCPQVVIDMETLEKAFGNECMIHVTEEEIRDYATNGLPVGRDLLAPHLVPARVQSELARAGMNVTLLPMHELCEKAGGASRCLVSRGRVDRLHLPEAFDYRARRKELEQRCR